jgi:hypothetical protein
MKSGFVFAKWQEIADLLEAIEKETRERIDEEKAQAAKARSLTDGELFSLSLYSVSRFCGNKRRADSELFLTGSTTLSGRAINCVHYFMHSVARAPPVILQSNVASCMLLLTIGPLLAQHCHGASRSSTGTTTLHLSARRCQSPRSLPRTRSDSDQEALLVEMEEVDGESVDRGSRRASRRERGAEFCSRACEGTLDDLLGATAINPFILLSAPILASPVRKRACGYRFEPR